MPSKRVITSIVLVPILYIIVWELPAGYFAGLALLAAVLGQHEFYQMDRARGKKPLALLGMALGAIIILEFTHPLLPGVAKLTLTAGLLVIMLARLFSEQPVEGAGEDIAATLLGVMYVALLFGYQVGIRLGPSGKQWLVLMYLVIWASDTGAYYVGTAFGRHRLYEKISPKKSIEGLVGGVLASVIVALICRIWFLHSLHIGDAVFLGVILAIVGTLGDLVESLLKRSSGVKDSGTLIPGHGGILDRMDSMLFAAPVLYYYLRMR